MSKPKAQPVSLGKPNNNGQGEHNDKPVEPLSGSKKVKNRQHSRQNHGEGF
ncbi:small acid-soluble spore protein P [Paenibacillus sp. GP183]|uniref:small acid-soluble spore protein P n=1 Tax=Paenibacillus sp. GP183 TaxID=1882751 RepID=UPI000897EB08|nr:small acid-soluble spore protein P [Paenibacillus sp. GP183]SEC31691.1 small acid-soluble spore protein P (minor) [Paenibacillus sp. GP183]